MILIVGVFSTNLVGAVPDDGVSGAANHLSEKFKVADASKEFKVKKVNFDELGYKHVKVNQMVEGIPVYGSEYIVHFDQNGNVYAGNGRFEEKAKDFKAKGSFIKEKEAIQAAAIDTGYIAGESDYQEDMTAAELYLYQVNDEFIPVYLVKLNWLHEDSFGDWRVFVSAYTGEVVDKYSNIQTGKPGGGGTPTGTNEVGTGVGVLGDSKAVNTILSNGAYYLIDKTKPMTGSITTYNAQNGTRLPGAYMTDTDNTWNTSTHKAAVDAHVYAGQTYDYYSNLFGRNSIDNKGMTIKSTVHYSRNYVNAFWNGIQFVYGDGDGVNAVELSGALDVVAHEYTHGVTSYEADLEYRNQSGALNESMSDVFGTAVEFYYQGSKADWLVGEDVWTPNKQGDALRSMENPTLYGDPDHMSKYVNTTSDNGGVHTNSGIPNKAAYLVGSKIGTEKMARIYYRALANYMTITTNFSQARALLLQSAADLYGAGSIEYNAVKTAFDSVGIY